ncbi:MAG: protein kinase, partial [Anaerolineaceae bacterium]|nr:protein kinase [Anaerolineaceae bacterium]
MTLAIGTVLFKRYKIISVLGQGGMGSVYCAIDEKLNIAVAVKENLFLTDEYARQFEKEAMVMATLRHQNLPRVIDFHAVEGQGQYIVMDYIEGEDLRQRIERLEEVPERDVVLIGSGICDALDYLHNRTPQVLHRDIKPGNIKISPEGEVILVDFGLVKVIEEGSQATSTGARAMTPGYSPPEQYGTAHTDPRSDIYSLGATLYAALTGTIPEDGLDRATGKIDLTPVRKLVPKVSKRLAAAIETALEIEPDDRFQSAAEMRKALLEAGELTHLLPKDIKVTPPPLEIIEKELAGLPRPEKYQSGPKPSTSKNGKNRRSSKRMQKRNSRLSAFTLLMILIALVGIVAYYAPSLPGYLLTALAPKPSPTQVIIATATLQPVINTATSTPTHIAHTATKQPTKNNLPSVTPSATPLGGSYGEIAFSTDRSGSMQIWLMDASGNNLRQLTNTLNGACQPAFSPDGTKLAFVSPCLKRGDKYPGANIYIQDILTDKVEKMANGSPEGDYDPDFSPDGKKLAFTSQRTGKEHVFVINLETNVIEEISNSIQADYNPVWDPSGKNLAIVRQSTSMQIWILPTNGQQAWQFSRSGDFNNYNPIWSSDGLFILYGQTSASGGMPALVRRNYDDRENSKETRIPSAISNQPAYPIRDASISPDGKWLVYESWPDGNNHDIYVMDIEGGNRV